MTTRLQNVPAAFIKALAFSLICLAFFASVTAKTPTVADGTWLLKSDIKGVKAYIQITNCGGQSVVFLKFVNSNTYTVKLSWDEQITLAGTSSAQKGMPFTVTLTVAPGEVAATTCDKPRILQLISKPKLATGAVIQDFAFLNLSVTAK